MNPKLPLTFAVIFGSFTLGLYVAIQGPTLMDLIDILHVNNDIMSYSLAFASLAYSFGGLLSGFLFNYVHRHLLIVAFLTFFGIANMITPFLSNFTVFSVLTVFKMMCAGGTDCGGNVWILDMWPGKDAWLQALHFSFAVGCALGPLIVEPFLSNDYKEGELDKITNKASGQTTINDQNNESRIYIPYILSGSTSIAAALFLLWLYIVEKRDKRRANKNLRNQQQASSPESIHLTTFQQLNPASIEAGASGTIEADSQSQQPNQKSSSPLPQLETTSSQTQTMPPKKQAEFAEFTPSMPQPRTSVSEAPAQQNQNQNQQQQQQQQQPSPLPSSQQLQQQSHRLSQPQIPKHEHLQPQSKISVVSLPITPEQPMKFTSKAREHQQVGRPPYYVMFAIALAAMSLSCYCGIEITSMNYLATFAVNIDLQLPKATAALMSSALTISFAVGRGIGIWVAANMRPHKLFYLCCAVMAVGNVMMLMFANTAEALLWFSIALFGIGCGPMFPAIVSFYDDKISKVTNTVSGIFILGSMFNVALNSLIIGHHIIDNALILIICNLVGSCILLLLFGTLHMLTKVKINQRVRKFKLKQRFDAAAATTASTTPALTGSVIVANISTPAAKNVSDSLVSGSKEQASTIEADQQVALLTNQEQRDKPKEGGSRDEEKLSEPSQ